jgi:hypothetical protein
MEEGSSALDTTASVDPIPKRANRRHINNVEPKRRQMTRENKFERKAYGEVEKDKQYRGWVHSAAIVPSLGNIVQELQPETHHRKGHLR